MFLVAFAFMCVGCYTAYRIGYGVGEQDGYEAGTQESLSPFRAFDE